LADGLIHRAKQGFDVVRQHLAAPGENDLARLAVADSRFGPSGHPALRRQPVEEREARTVSGTGGLDELFGPGDRLVVLDPKAEERRASRDGGGNVEIALFG